ncbi:MAG: T9SS type A sorting domain-containing protein [Prevotella sp.]|nr:T9SS type A sorting domain-containing protein [Prevotella sp.]
MKKKTNLWARAAMLLLAVLGSVGAWAQDEAANEPVIIIWLNDGNKTEVLFADMPEFTYADGNISLQSNNPSTTLSWPIENLQKLTFENVTTAIRDIKATGLDILSDKMAVYDLSGKMLKKQIKSLSELSKGVYIVKDGSVSIKVVRK